MRQVASDAVPNDGPIEIDASQLDLISGGSAINIFRNAQGEVVKVTGFPSYPNGAADNVIVHQPPGYTPGGS